MLRGIRNVWSFLAMKGATMSKSPNKEHAEEATQERNNHNIELGRRGENAAVAFLERRGFEIVERNWRCKVGEVDIIALEDSTLHLIEVKTRMSEEQGFPTESITSTKRKKYEVLAEVYLRSANIPADTCITFDAIGIIVTGENTAFLKFHRDVLTVDR